MKSLLFFFLVTIPLIVLFSAFVAPILIPIVALVSLVLLGVFLVIHLLQQAAK